MPEQQRLEIHGITMPQIEGAAPAAIDHFISNLPFSGLADNPFALERVINRGNAVERRLSHFLRWVDKKYAPRNILYPFSGWHTTPRDIFGDSRVIHLSNETDNMGAPRSFLRDLEHGLRVAGDARNQPFADRTFDAVFLRMGASIADLELEDLEGGEGLIKVMDECRRVVKPKGLFIIESAGQKSLVDHCKKILEPEKLPEAVNKLLGKSYWVFRNEDKNPTEDFWSKSARISRKFVDFIQYKT